MKTFILTICYGFLSQAAGLMAASVPTYSVQIIAEHAGYTHPFSPIDLNNAGQALIEEWQFGTNPNDPNDRFIDMPVLTNTTGLKTPPCVYAGCVCNHFGTAVNDLGFVVGYSQPTDCATGGSNGFLISNQTAINLKNFKPFSLNNKGQIVGMLNQSAIVLMPHGYVIDLSKLFSQGHVEVGLINDVYDEQGIGEVFGQLSSNGAQHAFCYKNQTLLDLGAKLCPNGNNSTITATSPMGNLLGYCRSQQTLYFAYHAADQSLSYADEYVNAADINDKGWIVAQHDNLPYLIIDGQPYPIYDLISPDSYLDEGFVVKSINNQGQILGGFGLSTVIALLTPNN